MYFWKELLAGPFRRSIHSLLEKLILEKHQLSSEWELLSSSNARDGTWVSTSGKSSIECWKRGKLLNRGGDCFKFKWGRFRTSSQLSQKPPTDFECAVIVSFPALLTLNTRFLSRLVDFDLRKSNLSFSIMLG